MPLSGSKQQVSKAMPKNLSSSAKQAARRILVLTASADLTAEAKEKIRLILDGPVDWQYLLELADFHEVGPLLSYHLLHNDFTKNIPKAHAEKLNASYHNSLHKNMILADELAGVVSAFDRNNIPVIVLKGITLAEMLYNNPGLRIISDIDIMVKPDMISGTKSALLELGYQPETIEEPWDHPFHEIPYVKKAKFPVVIELHNNLDDPRVADIPLQIIWNRAQKSSIQGISSLLLSPEDTLLYIASYFSKPSNYNLKSLSDINELLKKYNNLLDWNYILDSARSWRVQIPLWYTLTQARYVFGALMPETAIQTLKPAFWRNLLLQLIVQDTFITPIKWNKLRVETLVVRNSLMMDRPGKMITVLSRFRGYNSKLPWLRAVMWIFFVFLAALGRRLAGPMSKKDKYI